MTVPAPHFLLFSESRLKRKEAERQAETDVEQSVGHWRFVLEALDGSEKFEADDEEVVAQGDRLELLAVVRGLEALDQPSRVTLVTPSRYVSRGLRFGLEEWRESGWLWERFGRMTPVKNHDLWQRVDRALAFHKVECRTWQFDHEDDALAERIDDESGADHEVELKIESAVGDDSSAAGNAVCETSSPAAEPASECIANSEPAAASISLPQLVNQGPPVFHKPSQPTPTNAVQSFLQRVFRVLRPLLVPPCAYRPENESHAPTTQFQA